MAKAKRKIVPKTLADTWTFAHRPIAFEPGTAAGGVGFRPAYRRILSRSLCRKNALVCSLDQTRRPDLTLAGLANSNAGPARNAY
jgi:hypothetical protein